jgi:DNA end-binding protein Ku
VRAIWKGTISFGLVNIPVALGVATKRSDPKFRMLDAETLHPVRRQYVVPERSESGPAGQDTVPAPPREAAETVRGLELDSGRFVVISPDELEALKADRRRTIDIEAFVDVAEIDPVHYDRSYYVMPQQGSERPYALLLEAMRRTGRAAVGRFVLSRREHLALVRPAGDALVLELLFYPEDVRPKDEIEDRVRGTEVLQRELDVATQLVESLARPFDPDEFENERNRELQALVERKLAGDEVSVAPEPRPSAAPAPDLMEALEASVREARSRKRATEPKRERSRRAASKSG